MSDFPGRPPARPRIDTDRWLHCPKCQQMGNLHHDTVQVFNRSTEDSDSGLLVTVQELAVQATSVAGVVSYPRNPSTRRDGVSIHFWCECCNLDAELVIAQHKGNTIIEWRGV